MPKNTGPKAPWSDKEVEELVLYLHSHCSTADHGSSFRDPTFNAAAEHFVLYLKSGPQKTGKMVKAKWMALQKIYTVIKTYQGLSGCHWDSTNGCSIQGKNVGAVLEEYVEHNGVLQPFKNKGWSYHQCMQDIIPTGARGSNTFSPVMGFPTA
ncbi:hypothetical protein PAXRUDRAFT_121542, partial [Paxillus rubicundulus Ve08.2h10]